MKEGFWVNYQQDKIFPIDDHELWVRREGNASTLGVGPEILREFCKFRPKMDRDEFLLFLIKSSPIMRIRGHGTFTTFEFSSTNQRYVVDWIWLWSLKHLGPQSTLWIRNFKTGKNIEMRLGNENS